MTRRPAASFALFAYGFRPYFLIAGAWVVLAVGIWIAALHGAPLPDGPLPMQRWHGHEMIAGFIGAAMCGFLLTAIPSWTGRRGYAGGPLVVLTLLFIAARLVLLPGSPLPASLAALIALLPLPALLAWVLPALVKAGTMRLFGPPALVLLFWLGDLLMLGDAAGWWAGTFETGTRLSLNGALALVGLIGGRIVPSFTLSALRRKGLAPGPIPFPAIDIAGQAALLGVVLVDLAVPDGVASGLVAALAAPLVLARLARWRGLETLDSPILWVLHLAYLFVPLALATKAAFLLAGGSWAAAWLHMQSIGAIGLMILAVMTRATLGHTGRDLVAPPACVVAFVLVPLAALVRVVGVGLLAPMVALGIAATLLMVAFALFVVSLGGALVMARVDGKPG